MKPERNYPLIYSFGRRISFVAREAGCMHHALSPVRSQWAQHTAELRVRLGHPVYKPNRLWRFCCAVGARLSCR